MHFRRRLPVRQLGRDEIGKDTHESGMPLQEESLTALVLMKTKLNHTRWLVLAACLLAGVHAANAWYSPSQQRWINRDPSGEPGFESLRRGEPRALADGPNSYSFVHNDPTDKVDTHGLWCYQLMSCCPGLPPTVICKVVIEFGDNCTPIGGDYRIPLWAYCVFVMTGPCHNYAFLFL